MRARAREGPSVWSNIRAKPADLGGFRHNLVAHPFRQKTNGLPRIRDGLSLNSIKLTLGGWISLHTYVNRLPLSFGRQRQKGRSNTAEEAATTNQVPQKKGCTSPQEERTLEGDPVSLKPVSAPKPPLSRSFLREVRSAGTLTGFSKARLDKLITCGLPSSKHNPGRGSRNGLRVKSF
jgi:hypothetical protein